MENKNLESLLEEIKKLKEENKKLAYMLNAYRDHVRDTNKIVHSKDVFNDLNDQIVILKNELRLLRCMHENNQGEAPRDFQETTSKIIYALELLDMFKNDPCTGLKYFEYLESLKSVKGIYNAIPNKPDNKKGE